MENLGQNQPLRGTDGGFTKISILERLPTIMERIFQENEGMDPKSVQILKQFEESIRNGNKIQEFFPSEMGNCLEISFSFFDEKFSAHKGLAKESLEEWRNLCKKWEGKTWLEIPWFKTI